MEIHAKVIIHPLHSAPNTVHVLYFCHQLKSQTFISSRKQHKNLIGMDTAGSKDKIYFKFKMKTLTLFEWQRKWKNHKLKHHTEIKLDA